MSHSFLPDIAGNPVELRQSRRKWALLLLGCLAGTAGGIWLISDGAGWGWLTAGVFGVGVLGSVGALLRPVRLVLRPDGFTIKGWVRERTYRWADIEEFFPAATGVVTQVAWKFRPSYVHDTGLRKVNRTFGLPDAGLGDTFGLTVDELVDVMNAWRRRFESSTSTRELA